MSFWAYLKVSQFSCSWHCWKYLSLLLVKINLMQHKFASFFQIWQLVYQSEVKWCHCFVSLNCGWVRNWPLVFSIASVKNTMNFTSWGSLVHTLISQVIRDPTSIYKYSARLFIFVNMSVKWSNYLNTFLTFVHFLYLDLPSMVKHSSDANWFHLPFTFWFLHSWLL